MNSSIGLNGDGNCGDGNDDDEDIESIESILYLPLYLLFFREIERLMLN